jgi:hypothetical protein
MVHFYFITYLSNPFFCVGLDAVTVPDGRTDSSTSTAIVEFLPRLASRDCGLTARGSSTARVSSNSQLRPTLPKSQIPISSHLLSLPPRPYVYIASLLPHNPQLEQARQAVCLSWLDKLLLPATSLRARGPVHHKNLAVVVLCRTTPSAPPLTRAG